MKNVAIVLGVALAACGGSSDHPDAAIAITQPTASASVALGTDADKSVTITYTLTNFTVKTPGGCGGPSANCGHVHVLIDGPVCNNGTDAYNNSSYSSTQGTALFGRCPPASQAGNHTVELQLHDDNHNPVKTNAGQEVKTSVAFTTH